MSTTSGKKKDAPAAPPAPAAGAREAAHRVLGRVTGRGGPGGRGGKGGGYADILLDSVLPGVVRADRALATELVYGVLRNVTRLDWTIDSFSSIKTEKMERAVLNALRLGAYQLLFLAGVPARAAINETVKLVKKGSQAGTKRAGFVNAVLRRIDSKRGEVEFPDLESDPAGHISVVYSHPRWLVRRWLARYGADETLALCRANVEAPPRTIRVNTLVTTPEALAGELAGEGLAVERTIYSPVGLKVAAGGPLDPGDRRYYIQDEASQLVALLLGPAPGQTVLDACAAPGGKATHIAQLMDNRGSLLAVDRSPARLEAVERAAGRLGATIVRTLAADASRPMELGDMPPAGFDAVLLDAPCTGLGVLRRTPDIKLRRTEGDIKRSSELQGELLANLSASVARGGRLVYSVCTFEPEETDEVVDAFLSTHRDFSAEDARGCLPPACGPLVDEGGRLRTMPHRGGMDGFFAARLRRN